MFILAEITDKMPTILQMWLYSGMVATLLAGIGLTHRHAAGFALIVSFLISFALAYNFYQHWLANPTFRIDIQNELGNIWIVNSLSSTLFPALVGALVIAWHLRYKSKSIL